MEHLPCLAALTLAVLLFCGIAIYRLFKPIRCIVERESDSRDHFNLCLVLRRKGTNQQIDVDAWFNGKDSYMPQKGDEVDYYPWSQAVKLVRACKKEATPAS